MVMVAVIALAVFCCALQVSAEGKRSIKSIMETTHKGKTASVQTIIHGEADEKLLKEFLEYYKFMATQKPSVGDEESWKKKTAALVDATQALIDKKDKALEDFKAAVECKACHDVHTRKKHH
jgi:hypothetical protein